MSWLPVVSARGRVSRKLKRRIQRMDPATAADVLWAEWERQRRAFQRIKDECGLVFIESLRRDGLLR